MPSILIIDDEDYFRSAVITALQRKGYQTHEASGGRVGMDIAREVHPDLVLCDVAMDDMDGFATLECLRQEPITATTPVIFMTGMTDAGMMRRSMNLGADDFLNKPFTASELFSAIDVRLKKHQVVHDQAERKLADLRRNLSLALPHELMTPLNGIFGLAELIANDAETLGPEEVAEMSRNILTSAERLHRLVQNFILYGQLELVATDDEGIQHLRRQQARGIRELILQRAHQQAAHFDRTNDLRLALGETEVPVAIAPDMLTKIIDELTNNAFKFSPRPSLVLINAAFSEGFVTIAVTDHGCGIKSEQIQRIGAYTQFDRATREQQGSGLGLVIAKRLTELHGGRFSIESTLDAGTAISVVLPIASPPPNARSF